ncbi:hypothetical protein BgiBS90_007044, partial [Biomphalaria glabrata]
HAYLTNRLVSPLLPCYNPGGLDLTYTSLNCLRPTKSAKWWVKTSQRLAGWLHRTSKELKGKFLFPARGEQLLTKSISIEKRVQSKM